MQEVKSVTGLSATRPSGHVPTTGTAKFLTFNLAREIYGIEILKVKEIIGLMAITRVPRLPEYLRGVINLRGKVIPVTDLRVKFGMETAQDTNETCIIVVDAGKGQSAVTTGLLVDSVSEVLDIATESIEAAPSLGGDVDTDFILGIGKARDKVILLLNIDKVIDLQTIDSMEVSAV